jgi:hypothetical protein
MWFTSLLASLKRVAGHQPTRRSAQGRRKERRPDALRARPRLEALEDRTVPSITWVAPQPGEWSDPGNWLDGTVHRVPGPTDNVTLPGLPGTYTVSQSTSSCKSLSLSSASGLSIQSGVILAVYGSATLNGPVTIGGTLESRAGDPWTVNGAVALSGNLNLPGYLSTPTGSSSINQPVTWTGGGSIRGGSSTFPVQLNSTITISGPARKALRPIMDVNPGAQIVHQGGDLDDGDATLNIKGTYDLQTDATITQFTDTGYFNVKNGGVLRKSGGSGVATVGGEFTISAGGQVVNQTGTLNLQLLGAGSATADDTGGTFVVAQGTRVSLVGSTGSGIPARFMGTYTGSGQGTVELKTNIAVMPGTVFNFPGPVDPPNGNAGQIVPHTTGAENGLSNILAPVNSLVGVFLGPGQPDQSPPPDTLDFSTADSRDYASLAPALQQVFYLGDGTTSSGGQHQVTVPDGATRLYLGTMSGLDWKNNAGAFSVQVGVHGTPLDNSFPVLVPGISDPWLAGMPNGSTASGDDVAPAQSPALVPDLAVNAGDVLTFTGKGSVNFYRSMFEWTAGNIFSQGGGALSNLGSMRIAASTPGGVDLDAPLNNSGTITQTAAVPWVIGPAGVVTNHGLFDLQTDGQSFSGSVFNNENDGTFRKSLSAGLANPNGLSAFNNHGGTIDVQRGTLDFRNLTGTHTGGTFYTADGTTLIPFGGTFTGTYTGANAGSGVVNLAGNTITVGAGGAILNFQQPGMLQWSGTQIFAGAGGLTNSGSLTLVGSSGHFLWSGVLTNSGTITHTGGGSLALASGTSLVNNGFYDLQGDASVGGAQGGAFQNNGTFRKSQGTGTSFNTNWVNNSGGTIDVESGTVRLNDSFTNSGTVILAPGTILEVDQNYTQSGAGTLDVQLGGAPASGQFGKLVVGSTATLAGTLQVDLVNGYGGNPGDVFTILAASARIGDFDNPILPPGAVWDVTTGTVSF